MKTITMICIALVAAAVSGWASGSDEVSTAKPPSTAFALKGSDLLYDRAAELRWEYEGDVLTVQTKDEERHQVEVVTPNVLRITYRSRVRLLIRIGSPEYLAVVQYRECVMRNDDKPLFEIETCKVPAFAAP